MNGQTFLLVASFSESLINFRGPLIDALVEAGLDVHVAAPDLLSDYSVAQALEAKGIQVHDIPLQRTGLNPITDFGSFLALLVLSRRIRPHYILCYTVKPVIYGSVAAWLAHVPNRFVLITGLGYAFTGHASGLRARLRNLILRLYRFSLTLPSCVFFQNPDDEAFFREFGLLPKGGQSRVVNGSGVNISEYQVASLPDIEPPSFLLIARLLGDKGVREYVAAAKLVKAKFPATQFLLVGWIDGNPDAISQDELDGWVAEGTLTFLGRLPDVRQAIEKCSVYVLPSYREGTPRTVLEAMAMGRAVITTDAPGCRETVVDGDNGFLVPVKDINALATAMMKMIDSPELVVRMGQRSRLIAEAKYDVHKVNAAMLEGMGIQ